MRAIPIDSFFEDLEGRRVVGAHEAVNAASFDWGRIVAEGLAARSAADGGCWRIGHLALLVERRYASGALQRFAEAIGESYGTVRRYRWVAKAYDADVRLRLPNLSFSHFQAVAGLPDRLTWLQRATRGRWSVDRLTRESRSAVAPTRGAPPELERVRSTIGELRRSLTAAVKLGDAALTAAGSEGLGEALDELSRDIDRLRERLRRAQRVTESRRPLKVARERGVAAAKPRTPAALKARAVGR